MTLDVNAIRVGLEATSSRSGDKDGIVLQAVVRVNNPRVARQPDSALPNQRKRTESN